MNPYPDSPYTFERECADLHCEHGWDGDITEGSVPKCIHCGDEFEYMPDDPKPCIERIAMALSALRIEHAAWGAIIDGLRASLACARQDIDRARSAARIVGFLDAAALIDDESTFDLTTALSEYINLDAMSVDGRARAIGVAEAAVAFAVRAIRAHADHLSKSESAWSES